ncbi:MAG: DUF262 domain-containing protein [Alphaproteobacteria bacterium]|nr:DUF262 domain-containing protein [Alphaproteobacteria bacterium]
MDNKVYYGEYSLRHWIDLILSHSIELPEYQRYYVWNQERVGKLYASLSSKHFVPPVIIGSFNIDGVTHNYIIDGQQRLSSVFLMYLGLFPDKKAYNSIIKQYANENDEERPVLDNVLEWRFNMLTEKGNTKQQILDRIPKETYKQLDIDIPDDFWESTYLGFSYVVPNTNDRQAQQKFYSSVFRNINMNGVTLTDQEKRTSLYFLNENLTHFFEPEISNLIILKNTSKNTSNYLDFVRYMALLSEYAKSKSADNIASGYSYSIEDYYERYIISVTEQDDSDTFIGFDVIFPDGKYESKLDKLNESVRALGLETVYSSIVSMDLYMFGLIYNVLFSNLEAKDFNANTLIQKLSDKLKEYQQPDTPDSQGVMYSSHMRNPARLKYLRQRIADSIRIYDECKNGN